jgi:hypothetical protein
MGPVVSCRGGRISLLLRAFPDYSTATPKRVIPRVSVRPARKGTGQRILRRQMWFVGIRSRM